jgi:hypothetical protein
MSEQSNEMNKGITSVSNVEYKNISPAVPQVGETQKNAATIITDTISTNIKNINTALKINKNEVPPIEELTTEQAAKRYIDLLVDLGSDFTHPRMENSRSKEGRRISCPDVDLFIKKYAAEHNKHNLRILRVAQLLDAEIVLNSASKTIKETENKIEEINDETQDMGFLKRLSTSREHKKIKGQLSEAINFSEQRTTQANREKSEILSLYYSNTNENKINPSDLETNQLMVDQLNARFFSDDRKSKIEEAMAIRIKFFDEGKHLQRSDFPEVKNWLGNLRSSVK